MPILWRYLLRSYFQVFSLCVSGFISVLLVTRFDEIARFTSSGAPLSMIGLFTAYQIPYILPIAIPISCLIAAILLFQRLSYSHELTALRTSGLGLSTIAYPLILAGCALSVLNFTIASELAPLCRGLSKELIYEMTRVNPLLLLQKETMVKVKNAYIDMKVLKAGKHAEDVVLIMRNTSNQRLGLMTAKQLSLEGELLTGKGVSFVSSVDPKKEEGFDHLVIENQASMDTKASHLSPFLQNADWNQNYDYLPLRMILARKLFETKTSSLSSKGALLEICRRTSLALAAFSFTLIGTAFGMAIGRNRKKTGVLYAMGLSTFFLLCFLMAKSLRYAPLASTLLYLLPHPLIILLSLKSLGRLSEGIE